MNDIEIRDVEHTFYDAKGQPAPVLQSINLSVESGEFLSLVGPSGCGKTTLLNLISGLIQKQTGEVKVLGEEPKSGLEGVGYLFARDSLMPWRTIQENAELAMEIAGWSKRVRREAARSLLAEVGLDGFNGLYPSQVSQGMRQRTAIVRTLATKPRLLLLDEPFSALDAQTKLLLQQSFSALWQETKATVVLITHDLSEAVSLSDRVALMTRRPGRLKTPFEIPIPRPRNLLDLQSDPRFHESHDALWQALRSEVETV